MMSQAKIMSMIWFTITFGISSNTGGENAISIGMLKLFHIEITKMTMSHLILKTLLTLIIYFLRVYLSIIVYCEPSRLLANST